MIPKAKAPVFLLLVTAAAVAILAPCASAAAAEPVTAAAESLRTGWYPDEAQLTPQLLEGGGFGRIFDTAVQGQMYAQPLVSGNTLFAATEDNWIYGIDPQSGAIQWQRNVGTPWNSGDIGCPDLEPHVGITGTPVIDPDDNVAYFTSKTYASGTSGPAAWYMHAVDLSNGEEEPGFPVKISGEAENLPGVSFNPTYQLQRPALLLMNGVIYAAFGSHCDIQPYEGWIVGVSTAGQIKSMWATAESGAAIWQAGGGLVSDGEGQIIFTSGNGPPPPQGPGDSPPEGELGESVVRVAVQPDGSLKASDFFSPYSNEYFNENDLDLGSGAPLALPSAYFGTTSIPDLLVEVGKPGIIYLLNRDDLGGMGQGPGGTDRVVQEIPETGPLWGSMAAWPGDGGYIYVPTVAHLEVLKYETSGFDTPQLSVAAVSPEYLGYGSGSPVVTSSGTEAGSGIVWVSQCPNSTECEGSTLNAYGAVPAEGSPKLIWSEEIGVASKFARPDVSGGHIYVGTFNGHLLGFGRLGPPAPRITGTDPPSPANDDSPEVKGEAEAGSTVRLYADPACSGAVLASGSAASFASPGLTPSPAIADNTTTTLYATATDGAGHTSYCSTGYAYTEDSVPPQTKIDSGPDGPTRDSTPSFSFSSSEANSSFECRLDGGAFAACRSPFTTAALADGAHSFEVRATDAAGNTDPTPASRGFSVDTQPPAGRLSAKPKQRVNGPLRVEVDCVEACAILASGRVTVSGAAGPPDAARTTHGPKLHFALASVKEQLAAAQGATLKLTPRRRSAWQTLGRLVRRGSKAKAAIRVEFADRLGNSRVATVRVALRRK